jgi:hypothetical protein
MPIITFDGTPNALRTQRICANQIRTSQDLQLLIAHLGTIQTFTIMATDMGTVDAGNAQALQTALVALKVNTDAALTAIVSFYNLQQV